MLSAVMSKQVDFDDFDDFASDLELDTSSNRIQDTKGFTDGIIEQQDLAAEFENQAKKSSIDAIEYVAANCNPNQNIGMVKNALNFLMDWQAALNRNCVYCSKAVELNLNSLVKNDFDTFFVVKETSEGALSQDVKNKQSFGVAKEDVMSTVLSDKVQAGSRAIIYVPVKDQDFSHAMNFIHHEKGSIVIDGQFGKVYHLNDEADKKQFDEKYGTSTDKERPCTLYVTGDAPVFDAVNIDDEWQVVAPINNMI
ncbi:hypothetical protein [uncultured Shewanella sp.]|uniref:hypothetical protein n=1 Tax=uncultured Shewanella sp. TaxID=173975 RepID=UPI0026236FBC|nr:hypothetical protein [uncultured Shewanella sp.]